MRFEILPAAEVDLAEQYSYLFNNASEETANRLLLAAEAAFSTIKQRPQIGTPCSIC